MLCFGRFLEAWSRFLVEESEGDKLLLVKNRETRSLSRQRESGREHTTHHTPPPHLPHTEKISRLNSLQDSTAILAYNTQSGDQTKVHPSFGCYKT